MFKMNNHGMGMVEVLVAGAMAAIVSLGVATMMQNSMKESRRMVILDTLKNKKILFDNMLRDPNIWTATLNTNPGVPFTTLKTTNTATAAILLSNPQKFILYNADNTIAYNLLGPSDVTGPYNGFTEKGGTCSNFYATAGGGNDACPFSYRLLVGVECVNGSPCMNPSLKLVARLVYNPAPNGTLSSFTNFIMPVATTSIADNVVDSKYDSVIKRTSTSVNRSFRMVSAFTPTGSGCAVAGAGGAGSCSTASLTIHPLTLQSGTANGQWDDTAHGGFDPNDLVTPGAATTGKFKFTETGYYSCSITLPAFATNGFKASLRNETTGTDVATASVTAGLYSQAIVTIDAKFNVTDASQDYAVREMCEADGTAATPSYQYCTLGIPMTTYSGYAVIISVNCYKIDRSM
jgi:hypothetical protein